MAIRSAAPGDEDEGPAFVPGLGALADRYDVVLCDVWGVLHNSIVAFPAAYEALARYREGGGRVVLITNAPRPNATVAGQLGELGVPPAAYDAIVASGDLTRAAVAERRGMVVHHLGPPRDHPIFDGLDVRFGALEEADYVVCSGLFDDERETVADYRDRLGSMRARGLEMICANPDLVVERGDRLIPCAGVLAEAYEGMGGRVFYSGKPHRPLYEAALRTAEALRGGEPVARTRVLAIGDAIRTDIAGAVRFGVDALFAARGIHARELGLDEGGLQVPRVREWLRREGATPRWITDELAWE